MTNVPATQSGESTSSGKVPARPVLIWITQTLLLLVMLLMGYSLIIAVPRVFGAVPFSTSVFFALLYAVGVFTFACALFIGLMKAKNWSWYGSIAFATLILVMVFYGRINSAAQVSQIPSNQLLGAAIGELLVTVLVVMYPIRLYFSKKVRAFFRIY